MLAQADVQLWGEAQLAQHRSLRVRGTAGVACVVLAGWF